jgi:hypothetical protein
MPPSRRPSVAQPSGSFSWSDGEQKQQRRRKGDLEKEEKKTSERKGRSMSTGKERKKQ